MPTNNSANYRPVQYNTLVGAANGGITSISPGTTGQVLTSNGASANPSYQSIVTQSQGSVLLQTLTASNSSSVSFDSSVITNQYPIYMIQFNNIIPSTNGVILNMDWSQNNGSTYLNSGYQSGVMSVSFNSTTVLNSNSTTTNPISNAVGNTGGYSGALYLYGLQSGGSIQPCYSGTTAFLAQLGVVGGNNTSGSLNINNLKFSFSSGNISSGTISLYGIPQTPIIPTYGNLSINTQVFTYTGSTQTYTPTANMQYCIVEVVGGGGGGGGCASTTSGQTAIGGSGGGGGYSRSVISAATIGASKSLTIGAGGAGGSAGANNGTAGGTTSFGTGPMLQATGGSYGGGGSSASGAAYAQLSSVGGVGSLGQLNCNGGASSPGWGAANAQITGGIVIPGNGGNSIFGGGAAAVSYGSTSGTFSGVAGTNYGGGATGATSLSGGSAGAGGAGAPGICIVTEYIVS